MQFMWLYIDDFVGKGLDVVTILKFMALQSTTLVPIALPLGILFASIMTFGNLGETNELTAIKSSGISILKFIKPLFVFIICIAIASFLFNNYVIPVANLKAIRMLYDITNKKPVVAIKEGTFYKDIPNQVIYIGKKDADNITIHDVKIYDHTSGRGNDKVLLAKDGKMFVTDDKQYLVFELQHGWRYEEKTPKQKEEHEQVRMGFSYWKKVFDLNDFKLPNTDENYFKSLRSVMNVKQIAREIDSTKKMIETNKKGNIDVMVPNVSLLQFDTCKNKIVVQANNSITNKYQFVNNVSDSLKTRVISFASTTARSIKTSIEMSLQNYKLQKQNLTEHQMEMHRRFTLPYACLVLFLIGVALGAIIKKGGMGMPMVFAVSFFVIYHLLNTIGEKFAKQQYMPAWLGMWFSSIILTLIAILLLYRANKDKQLINTEKFQKLIAIFQSIFKKNATSNV